MLAFSPQKCYNKTTTGIVPHRDDASLFGGVLYEKNSQIIWLIIFVIALILVLVNAFTGLFPEPVSQLFSLAVNILLPVWTFWAWRTSHQKYWLYLCSLCCVGLALSLVTLGMTLFA